MKSLIEEHMSVFRDFFENNTQILALKLDAERNVVDGNHTFRLHLARHRTSLGAPLESYFSLTTTEKPKLIVTETGQEPFMNLMRLNGANAKFGIVAYEVDAGELLLIGEKRFESESDELEMMTTVTNDIANVSRELKRKNRELEKANATILKISQIDMLTEVANRRHFFEQFGGHFASSIRHGYSLSVAMLDIDHFKNINDTFGHQAGDRTLVGLSKLLKASLRRHDLPARYGGEEFIISLPHTDHMQGLQLLERLRTSIQESDIMKNGRRVTVSMGLAQLQGEKDEATLISRADKALYQAKENGRNQVVISAIIPSLAESIAGPPAHYSGLVKRDNELK